MHPLNAVATAVFSASMLSLAIGAVGFIRFRNVRPISNRDYGFSFMLWLGLVSILFQTWSNFVYLGPCEIGYIILKGILTNCILVYAVRFLEYYAVYTHVGNVMATADLSVDSEEFRKSSSNLVFMWLSTRRGRYIVYAVLHSIQVLIMIVNVLGVVSAGEPLSNACKNNITTVGAVYTAIVMLGLLIGAAIKIRKLHDAYGIKRELGVLGVLGICFGLPVYFLTFFSTLKQYGFLGIMLVYWAMAVMSFLYPVWCAYRTAGGLTQSMDFSGDTRESHTETKSRSDLDLDTLVNNEIALKYVSEFAQHRQLIDESNCLLFYKAILDWISAGDAWRGGKLIRMYGKFISADAYLAVSVLDDAFRESIAVLVQKLADDPDTQVPDGLFDLVKYDTAQHLVVSVLEPFRKSREYKMFKQNTSLSSV